MQVGHRLNARAFEHHLAFVMAALRDGQSGTALPVVIVIQVRAVMFAASRLTYCSQQEFDVFARRSKQTLLYALLDATASASARLAVVGLTRRLDAIDLLEKRLK